PGVVSAALGLEEPQVAIRGGQARAPRLRSASQALSTMASPVPAGPWNLLDPEGTVLVTGGTGALGGAIARHLVIEHGVRAVLLASRRGVQAPGAQQLQSELSDLGAQVTVAECDLADEQQVERLIASIPERIPLRAVVHAAGVIEDGVIGSLSADGVERVLASKVDAALHLDRLTRHLDLSAFVLFSSVAGTMGSPGQGSYAAANACLDALARVRRTQGLAAVSIGWGLWSALEERELARIGRWGIQALSPHDGLALFDEAGGGGEAHVLAVRFDAAVLRSLARSGALPALLRGLPGLSHARASRVGKSSLSRDLARASSHEHEAIVLAQVRAQAAAV